MWDQLQAPYVILYHNTVSCILALSWCGDIIIRELSRVPFLLHSWNANIPFFRYKPTARGIQAAIASERRPVSLQDARRFSPSPWHAPAALFIASSDGGAYCIAVQVLMHTLLYCGCIYSLVGVPNSTYVMATGTISASSTFTYLCEKLRVVFQISCSAFMTVSQWISWSCRISLWL